MAFDISSQIRWYENGCQVFEPTLTDAGICYVYNAKKLGDLLLRNESNNPLTASLFEGNTTVKNPLRSGTSADLVVGLDIQTSRLCYLLYKCIPLPATIQL